MNETKHLSVQMRNSRSESEDRVAGQVPGPVMSGELTLGDDLISINKTFPLP